MNARMTFGCHWFQSIQFLTGTKVGDNVKYSFDDQCKSVDIFISSDIMGMNILIKQLYPTPINQCGF